MLSDEQIEDVAMEVYGTCATPQEMDFARALIAKSWQSIETAPRDGSHILTYNVTPTYDEDERKTVNVYNISIAYWLFGSWMEFPAAPRFVQGQEHTHWMPLPAAPKESTC